MIHSEKGSLLIVVIIAIVVISALGVGIAAMVTTGVRSSTDHSLSIQALYLAESGIEWAGNELKQEYVDTGDWTTECNNLEEDDFESIEDTGYFAVLDSDDENNGCAIKVLGWVGSEDQTSSLASRRIQGTIPKDFIENGNGENVFDDENKWNNLCGSHRECRDDGSIKFSKQNDKDELNRSAVTAPLVEDDAFDETDSIYLALQLTDENLDKLANFGLNKLPPDNTDRDWINDAYGEFGDFNAVVDLGDGYTPESLNDQPPLQFFIKWSGGNITVEQGCIGTISSCTSQSSSVYDWSEE